MLLEQICELTVQTFEIGARCDDSDCALDPAEDLVDARPQLSRELRRSDDEVLRVLAGAANRVREIGVVDADDGDLG